MRVIEQKNVFIYRFIILNLVKVLRFIKSRRKFPETRQPKLSVFKEKEEHAFLFKFGPSYLRNFFAGFCKTSMVY